MYLPLFVGVLCWSLFWYALLYVLSSFAIILTRTGELVALLLLSFGCLFVTENVLWPFLTVPWVGLKCVIVVFPYHTHLLFYLLPLSHCVKMSSKYNRNIIISRVFIKTTTSRST